MSQQGCVNRFNGYVDRPAVLAGYFSRLARLAVAPVKQRACRRHASGITVGFRRHLDQRLKCDFSVSARQFADGIAIFDGAANDGTSFSARVRTLAATTRH